MSKYWSKLCCLKGGGSLWAQISGGRGSSANEFWRQKNSHSAIMWCCLRDPTFSCFDTIPASCDTQTDTQTDTRFAVLHNPWWFGGAPVGHHLVRVWSVNLQKRSTYTFQSFCLKVDCLSAHDRYWTYQRNHNQKILFFFSLMAVGLFIEWA